MAGLEGKTAIVTGASSGIGAATATALAWEGARVAGGARRVVQLQTEIRLELDVTDRESCERFVQAAIGELGGLDILVNNAGVTRDNLLLRIKEEDWDAVLDTNLKAPYLFIKAAGRYLMRSKAGRIINISSVAGILGNAGQANYASSKAGLIALTKTAARELGSRAVCVNAVAPGFIKTDMASKVDPKVIEGVLQHLPLKRLGEAKEVAAAVLFLASDHASYITGQVLVVDGGMAM